MGKESTPRTLVETEAPESAKGKAKSGVAQSWLEDVARMLHFRAYGDLSTHKTTIPSVMKLDLTKGL